jgi:hypothetical protein
MKKPATPIALLFALALTGCTHDETVRSETFSARAGHAIAHNNSLQIIDPAPALSRHGAFAVPVARGTTTSALGQPADGGLE